MATPTTGPTTTAALNTDQRAAVESRDGPLLVVAGAGTGKTRVITERVAHLLESLPDLSGESVLAVTYTDKAADEMRERIRRRTDKRGESVKVETFHAFCHWLLREHNQKIVVLDDTDYWIFLRRRLDQLGLEVFKNLSEPGRFLNDFQKFFSRCQDELVSPEDYSRYVDDLAAKFEQQEPWLGAEEQESRRTEIARQRELARAYSIAERLLTEQNRVTFGGLLLRAVELLRAQPELRALYQERFRYILVDEFQDANIAQIELLSLLAGRHRNLLVVGDDDQAIYRFRGASYASFRKFAELYPEHKVLSLTKNYRSTRRILQVATQLIEQNGTARFQPDKQLVPLKGAGEKVRLTPAQSPAEEAALVRAEIEQLHRSLGRYAGIAVLYRFHRHRRPLVLELMRARVPFVIRNLSILENTVVRDLLAYLRVTARPDDNVQFARLLAIPAWRVQPAYLFELAARARKDRSSLYQVVESLHPSVRTEHTRLEELLEVIRGLQERAETESVTALFEHLLQRVGLQLFPSDPDWVYLQELNDFLHKWEEEKSESKRLLELLEYLDYFEEAGGNLALQENRSPGDAVQLMTVHAAKGLEFHSVFVLRLNRREFPGSKRRPLFEFPEALMKEALPPGDFHVQEERRLCYVALTRAQDRLRLLTVPDDLRPPSIFLEDILRDARVHAALEQIRPATIPPPAAAEGLAAGALENSQGSLFDPRRTSRCYSGIALWPGSEELPPLEEPLQLSHSALDTYGTCPLRFLYSYRWQLPRESAPPLVYGQIMHRVIAQYVQARQRQPELPYEEVVHFYEQQWRQTLWPFRDHYQREEYYQAGLAQLRGFYERHRDLRPVVLEQEKKFRWPWEDVVVTGRIDQINRIDGRRVEIIEYKTGNVPSRRTVERSVQLALYAAATEAVLGLEPVRWTLYNLTSNEPISVEGSEKQKGVALERVRETAAGIRAGEFSARTGYHCRTCDYRTICPEYEQPTPLPAATPTAAGEAQPPKN